MKRFLALGITALLALLLLAGCGSTNTTSTTATTSGSGATPIATEVPVQKPTVASAGLPTVGKAYVVSDTWTITVNSVKTSQGDPANPYIKPDAGKQFVTVSVTMVNTSLQTQHVSDILMFSLRDSTGQAANLGFLQSAAQAPNGPVSAGAKLTGEIVYQVPVSEHALSLEFQPTFGADLTEWKLSV
jgi:hypothetical protein